MTPEELGKARILVTNDDGINAPGLDAMIDIAWGVFVSTASAAAGRAAWLGMSRTG